MRKRGKILIRNSAHGSMRERKREKKKKRGERDKRERHRWRER